MSLQFTMHTTASLKEENAIVAIQGNVTFKSAEEASLYWTENQLSIACQTHQRESCLKFVHSLLLPLYESCLYVSVDSA